MNELLKSVCPNCGYELPGSYDSLFGEQCGGVFCPKCSELIENCGNEAKSRIYISEENLNIAIEFLDNKFVKNDLDEGGRIIINSDDLEMVENILNDNGINFEII